MDKDLSRLHQLYNRSGIFSKWYDVTIDEFENGDKAKQQVLNYLKIASKTSLIGLNIVGVNGSGKTHLLNALAKGLIQKGLSVNMSSLSKLMTNYTSSFNSPVERQQFTFLVRDPDFLFVDDLGSEFKSDLAKKTLSSVINARINFRKPLMLASSLMPKEMLAEYGEEVNSRLKEICLPVLITGADYRNKIFARNKALLDE